jgi:phosphoribosylamine-glycine ligase
MDIAPDYASGVRVTIPPYPIEPESLQVVHEELPNYGVPVRGFEGFEDKIYFYEVELEDNDFHHSAGTGVICVISDRGNTINDSFDLPYQIAEEFKIPEKQYRTDLAEVIEKCYEGVTANA